MAHSGDPTLARIQRLLEFLSIEERRRCSFLCGTSDLDQTLPCLALLIRQVMRSHNVNRFLTEIFMRLGRFDILRNEFGISRDQVEKILMNELVLPKFRVLMHSLSEDLDEDNLVNLKFLVSGITQREPTKTKSFLDIVILLEKLDKVSSERVDVIEDYLRNIHRMDLAMRVRKYKLRVGPMGACATLQPSIQVTSPTPESPVQQGRCVPFQSAATNNLQAFVTRSPSSESPQGCYSFKANPRGFCLIIDCVGCDGEMLEHMFTSIQFTVERHNCSSVDLALSTFESFRDRESLDGESFVCCFISRGTADHLVVKEDRRTDLTLDRIKHHFCVCPVTADKPKMFFIQRYSVSSEPSCRIQWNDDDLEMDGPMMLPGMFWSHCWTNEQQLKDGRHCSIYLKELTNAIKKGNMRGEHLVDVHRQVTAAIDHHNRMNPEEQYHIDYSNSLSRNLYL